MKTTPTLALAVCLTLAACQGNKPKTTWQKVTETRPDKVAATGDASEAYAAKLHKMLTAENVEHKVVTYNYRYKTGLREEAVGTHSAVLYRDDSNPQNPWWLMDDRLAKPVWLPGQDASKQVTFYLRRKAQVIAQQTYPTGESLAAPGMIAKKSPVVPANEPAVTRIAKVKPAPTDEPRTAEATPAPFIRPARFGPATHEVGIPFTPAPGSERYDEVFRRAHGTDYDPTSPIDRRKMESIKSAQLDTVPATRTF